MEDIIYLPDQHHIEKYERIFGVKENMGMFQ